MRTLHLTVCSLFLLAACSGTEDPLALDEPLTVRQADFKDGTLPGSEPGTPAAEPAITSYTLGFGVLRPGTLNAQVTGRAQKSAYSVGVRFRDQGNGYWVRPVGSEDPLFPGELQWQFVLDAASAIEPGLHTLEVVAFDENGRAGTKSALPICVASELPDNLNVCDPKKAPPIAVAALRWNADSDLDLTVVAPDGSSFGRSKRSLVSGTRVLARLDGDGVSGCLADGRRLESFSWNEPSISGKWQIYANLFDACTKPSVSYELTIYFRQQDADGSFRLVPVKTVHGQFVRAQATGGAGNPLFLSEVELTF